jgi:hypothetical protein
MQKKLLILLTVALVGLGLAQDVGTSTSVPQAPKFQLGLDSLTIAWPSTDDKGGIVNSFGLNLGLGISYRSYFEPLYPGKGSLYWEAGTVLILIPGWVGIGYDYRFNEQFYVGGGVQIAPLVLLTGLLAGLPTWPIYPSIHLGVYIY